MPLTMLLPPIMLLLSGAGAIEPLPAEGPPPAERLGPETQRPLRPPRPAILVRGARIIAAPATPEEREGEPSPLP